MTVPLAVHAGDQTRDADWDDLVRRSVNGTFLHTRAYLGYHGTRFDDRSLAIRSPKGRLLAVVPAAAHPAEAGTVVSHPGITYGGVVHDGALTGLAMSDALTACCQAWREQGFHTLVYKTVPAIYHSIPAQDDRWALHQLGAILARRDLSATLDLTLLPMGDRNRRRNLAKARDAGIEIRSGADLVEIFWPMLASNLRDRFGVTPVHSSDEIRDLLRRCPDDIRCDVAFLAGEAVAGVVHYSTTTVEHPQYSASSEAGRDVGALDALFQHGIAQARDRGARWYDFGISTEANGSRLNDKLHQFKTSFGGGGVTYDWYTVPLERRDASAR